MCVCVCVCVWVRVYVCVYACMFIMNTESIRMQNGYYLSNLGVYQKPITRQRISTGQVVHHTSHFA